MKYAARRAGRMAKPARAARAAAGSHVVSRVRVQSGIDAGFDSGFVGIRPVAAAAVGLTVTVVMNLTMRAAPRSVTVRRMVLSDTQRAIPSSSPVTNAR